MQTRRSEHRRGHSLWFSVNRVLAGVVTVLPDHGEDAQCQTSATACCAGQPPLMDRRTQSSAPHPQNKRLVGPQTRKSPGKTTYTIAAAR